MSEYDPRTQEYLNNFGPKEKAEAILLLYGLDDVQKAFNEFDDQKQKNIIMNKIELLHNEIFNENLDEKMIMGLTSELKYFLVDRLQYPLSEIADQKLIQFLMARRDTLKKEHGVKEEFDPFREPKKKEYKN